MELTFAQQSAAFGGSVLLGAALAVFYGLLKFFRFAFSPGKAAVFALDVLFMLVWALSAFYFSLAFLSGTVRLYLFAGSLAGFLFYRFTVGRLIFMIYRPAVGAVRKLFQKICKKSKIFAKYLLKIGGRLLYNIRENRERRLHKKNSKKQSYSEIRKYNEKEKIRHGKAKSLSRKAGGRKKRSEGR